MRSNVARTFKTTRKTPDTVTAVVLAAAVAAFFASFLSIWVKPPLGYIKTVNAFLSSQYIDAALFVSDNYEYWLIPQALCTVGVCY